MQVRTGGANGGPVGPGTCVPPSTKPNELKRTTDVRHVDTAMTTTTPHQHASVDRIHGHGDECGLCNKRGATQRNGRLGRYAQTCESCEAARGSHLAQAS